MNLLWDLLDVSYSIDQIVYHRKGSYAIFIGGVNVTRLSFLWREYCECFISIESIVITLQFSVSNQQTNNSIRTHIRRN